VTLTSKNMRIEERPVGREVAEVLEIDPETPVTSVFRVLEASGNPAAVMFDVVHPSVELPPMARFERKLESGLMVLDVLIELGIAVGYARTRVMPCLVTPREQVGKALGMRRTTAALELEEVIYAGRAEPVAYSRDLFAPGALDVHVIRSLDASSPTPIGQQSNPRRRRNSRAR
jgi:GntR family transcriptional regulator